MHERGDFLASIIAHPNDDTVRLVYADWLTENGEPERGEYIRAQIELARWQPPSNPWCQRCGWTHEECSCTPKSNPPEYAARKAIQEREKALILAGRSNWTRPYPDEASYIVERWDRGFYAEINIPGRSWLQHNAALLTAHPIRVVHLTTPLAWDGNEDHAWLVNDPVRVRLFWTDIREEATEEELEDYWPAFLRLRWPGLVIDDPG